MELEGRKGDQDEEEEEECGEKQRGSWHMGEMVSDFSSAFPSLSARAGTKNGESYERQSFTDKNSELRARVLTNVRVRSFSGHATLSLSPSLFLQIFPLFLVLRGICLLLLCFWSL